jgi:hypothetical protein
MPTLHLTDIVVSQLKQPGIYFDRTISNFGLRVGNYLEVARVNGLAHFRDLAPGMQLLFPPLQDSAT